jgi:hypothetical protein
MANSKTFEDAWTESRIPYGALRSRREVAEFFWNAATRGLDIADACGIFRDAVRYDDLSNHRAVARHMVKVLDTLVVELEALEEAEENLEYKRRNQLRKVKND